MEKIERKLTEQSNSTVCMGFAIDGDCRFLSHRDTMRILELAVFRAEIDVYLSGGFNPRPKISLPLPRPVGMASQDELLVLRLKGAADQIQSETLAEKLNGQCPPGIVFSDNTKILDKRTIEIVSADHQTYLPSNSASELAERIESLNSQDQWLTQRKIKKSRRGPRNAEANTSTLDIKPMVSSLGVSQNNNLEFTLNCVNDRWAKPAELFDLLGLDARRTIARTRRTTVRQK